MLDTDICSYLIRRRDEQLDRQFRSVHPSSVCVSAVVRAELIYGLRNLPSSHRLKIDVPFFLNAIRLLSWDEKCADFYADIRYQLKRSGQPIGELDMMIAAHAIAVGAVLVTNNVRHYQRIPLPLQIENWVST
ncbi:type II toxin-antitoxin system VapC family toxin [Silvibacterium bohemicum]|nr:type II toxin-antitoxin system VapC family toxin [Silvibacterium bohemicum]